LSLRWWIGSSRRWLWRLGLSVLGVLRGVRSSFRRWIGSFPGPVWWRWSSRATQRATRALRRLGLERMLRIHFLQQWFDLSDPAVGDALYDSVTMRNFVGIDLGREPAPDETTVCKFRHLLEREDLGRRMLAVVNG
jgi:hypothetical protein